MTKINNIIILKLITYNKYMTNYIPLKDNLLCKNVILKNPNFGKKKVILEFNDIAVPEHQFEFDVNTVIVLAKGENVNPKIQVGMTLLLSMQRNFATEIVNLFEIEKDLLQVAIDGNTKQNRYFPIHKDVERKILVSENYIMCIIEETEEVKTDKLVNVKV